MQIQNISGRLTIDDTLELARLLIKAGYAVEMGSCRPQGKKLVRTIEYADTLKELKGE